MPSAHYFDVEGLNTGLGITITAAKGRVYAVAYLPSDANEEEVEVYDILLASFGDMVVEYVKQSRDEDQGNE